MHDAAVALRESSHGRAYLPLGIVASVPRAGRLAVGELDADLPGLPSGGAPAGVGSNFAVLVTVNTGGENLAANSVEARFDAAILDVDVTRPGTLMGVTGSSTSYAGPTLTNPGIPGALSFNHFHLGPPVSGVFDLAELHFLVTAAGASSFETCIDVLGNDMATAIGAAGPRLAPAASGNLVFP